MSMKLALRSAARGDSSGLYRPHSDGGCGCGVVLHRGIAIRDIKEHLRETSGLLNQVI